jgi:hypothetical protein
MTIDNWLMIAVIISTLIAPTLANLFPPRAQNQPTLTPEANQPKNLIHRIWGDWVRFSNSPWFLPPFLVVSNISSLLWELRKTTPVTRSTIFQMSFAVASIWYGVVLFFLSIVWRETKRQWETNFRLNETDQKILNIIRTLHDAVNAVSTTQSVTVDLVTTLAKPKPGRLPAMLATIKKFFSK